MRVTNHIFTLLITVYFFCLPSSSNAGFSFSIVSDQRQYAGVGKYNSPNYFMGAVTALKDIGAGVFMVSPGDIDPPSASKWTIKDILGGEYQWFPVVGNHELPGHGKESYKGENLEMLRAFDYDLNGAGIPPDIVNPGPSGCPETTFSFDFENGHFVILNEYCDSDGDDVTNGDIPNHLYNWLSSDLALTSKQHIFVFGHEPAFPQPDADNGRARHLTDGLNAHPANRDRFWELLKETGVVAYFCGHTHNYSVVKIEGVWQIDSGHARGLADTGAPSTILKVEVDNEKVLFTAFRDIHDNSYNYNDIVHAGILKDVIEPVDNINITPMMPLLISDHE